MALTSSTMLELGTPLPYFALPDTHDVVWHSQALRAPALVIAFICNHCPYVIHILDSFVSNVKKWQEQGAVVIAVSSNDVEHYPQDAPDRMRQLAIERRFSLPYLFDASQNTAKAFRAACTPEFFVFNQERLLTYRGRYDASRPGNQMPITGEDLNAAIQQTMQTASIAEHIETVITGQYSLTQKNAAILLHENQQPSMGCNIKWKPGSEPEYFLQPNSDKAL
ncbi:MAG: thioredoxin family protein [Pseudomonadota bacterium]